MPEADEIVLFVLADETALRAYGDAVYFDDPDGVRADMTGLFALRWLACEEIKHKLIQHCPAEHVPVQTRLQSRRFGHIQPACRYRLEVRFLPEPAAVPPQLKLEYCVEDQARTEITSGTVEMAFVNIALLTRQ